MSTTRLMYLGHGQWFPEGALSALPLHKHSATKQHNHMHQHSTCILPQSNMAYGRSTCLHHVLGSKMLPLSIMVRMKKPGYTITISQERRLVVLARCCSSRQRAGGRRQEARGSR